MGLDDGSQKLCALIAGEALAAFDACYIKSDGLVYKASAANPGIASPPAAPALSTATSGGTVGDGIYGVKVTYVNATGETLASDASYIECTGGTADHSTLTVTSPAAATNATKYKVYIQAKNGGAFKLQNSSGTNLGTDLTLTAPPVTNTATPPTSDTSGSHVASKVHGFAPTAINSGEPVSLVFNVMANYGASLTPGTDVYLSDATAGALADAVGALSPYPIGTVVDATRIYLRQSHY
jgi:hypothetical protein